MPRQVLTFPSFDGGLNLDVAPEQVRENELRVAQNIDIVERGGAAKRWGTDFVNKTSLAGRVLQLIEWTQNSGIVVRLAVVEAGTNNRLVQLNADGSTAVISNLLNKQRVGHFSLNDQLYLVDGLEYYQWSGSGGLEKVPPQKFDKEGKAVEDCDLTPIRKCTLAVRHTKSLRIFFAGNGSNRLYYSEPNDPSYVKELAFVVPTTGDGVVKGLAVFVDALLVYFTRSIWIWRGMDPASDAIWEKLPVSEGSDSPGTLELTDNQFEYLGSGSGHWAMTPALLGATAVINPGQGLWMNLAENKVQTLVAEIKNRGLASGAFDVKKRKNYLAFTNAQVNYCDQVLVRQTTLGSYTLYQGLEVYDLLYTSDGEVWFGSKNYVMKFKEWYRDACSDGTYKKILFDLQTPESCLGEPFKKKWVRGLTIAMANPGYQDYVLRVQAYADGTLAFETKYTPTTKEHFVLARFMNLGIVGKRISIRLTNDQFDTETLIYSIALDTEYILNSYGGEL